MGSDPHKPRPDAGTIRLKDHSQGIKRHVTIHSQGRPQTRYRELPTQWVIYYNPPDYPGKYVLRAWPFSPILQKWVPENQVRCVSDNKQDCYRQMPDNLKKIPPNPRNVNIHEVWI